jgi:hypothetical protein
MRAEQKPFRCHCPRVHSLMMLLSFRLTNDSYSTSHLIIGQSSLSWSGNCFVRSSDEVRQEEMHGFSTSLHGSFSSRWVFWVIFYFGFALVLAEGRKWIVLESSSSEVGSPHSGNGTYEFLHSCQRDMKRGSHRPCLFLISSTQSTGHPKLCTVSRIYLQGSDQEPR